MPRSWFTRRRRPLRSALAPHGSADTNNRPGTKRGFVNAERSTYKLVEVLAGLGVWRGCAPGQRRHRMNSAVVATDAEGAIMLAQAVERLRQETAAFDESMRQYRLWMRVRRSLLWVGIALLPAAIATSAMVIALHERFSAVAVAAASSALFVGVGAVAAMWKIMAGLAPLEAPRPTSEAAWSHTWSEPPPH